MYGILVDVTKCTGCEQCVGACLAEHGRTPDAAAWAPAGKDGLSGEQLCSIVPLEAGRFARKSCMHCLEPSCVAACLVGAITQTDDGPVVYDAGKCIGCRYCMLACPHHVPRYEWSKVIPFVKKCDMCSERLATGGKPACAEACPNGALRFGDRDELLAEANRTIAGNQGKYLPRVWGEHEWGGTSVMYISDVDLSALDWPAQDTRAIPELTDPMIEMTPFIGGGAAIGLWALGSIIARRNKVMAQEHSRNHEERSDD